MPFLVRKPSIKPSLSSDRQVHRPAFALVASLTIMVFILMLMLSLSTLVRIETVHSSTVSQLAEARQMALFSATQALGELQKNAGPDQRITARAEILDNSPGTRVADGVAQPYWTGVWTTEPDNTTDDIPHQSPARIKNAASGQATALTWLVSTPDANPLTHARAADDVPLLVVDADDPDDPRNIYLPLEDLKDANGNLKGKYAWWVADDGVKASVAMDNPWARSNQTQDAALTGLAATRMAPEFIQENSELEDLSVLTTLGRIQTDDSYTAVLNRIAGIDHLQQVLQEAGSTSNESQSLLKHHYHTLTTLSLGVLSDTREGGLKRNLSAAFSNPTDFQQLKDEHGELVFGHRNQIHPYDPLNSDIARATGGSQSNRRDPGGPPWEQLRSFYQMRADAVPVQPQTNQAMGVGPILTMIQVHTHMMLMRVAGTPDTAPQYIVRLMFFPAVMLWNPYNVDLPSTNYTVYLTTSGNKLKYNWTPEVDWTDKNGDSHHWKAEYSTGSKIEFEGGEESGNDNGAMRFNISSAFAPGEARLFVPAQVEQENWSSGNGNTLVATTSPGFDSGGYFYSDLIKKFRTSSSNPAPDLNKAYTLRLSRNLYTASNTSSINNMVALLGLGNGNNNLDTFIANVPIQTVGGFNQVGLSDGSGSHVFPYWKVAPTSISLFDDVKDKRWDQLNLTSLGGDNYFPIVGFTQHMRWNENLNPVTYSSQLTPIVSTLASYNPRAARSERTPIEHAQQPGRDFRYNSLYLNWTDTRADYSASNPGPGSSSSDWGDFYGSYNLTQPSVGYTDDPALSQVTQDTLFDIPQGPEYFQSVGSLMHASLAPALPRTNTPDNYFQSLASSSSDWNINSSYPAFAIGNSLAPLGVPLDDRSRHSYVTGSNLSSDPQSSLYDWSYLLNDYLWDRYFFAEYDTTNAVLLNPRLISLPDATEAKITSYDEAAEVLMVKGAFNVNSTSVDAWRAFLAGTVGADVKNTVIQDRAPYIHNQSPLLGNADTADEESAETYAGYRSLSAAEIDSLAEEIVKQVKKRGPFTSLAHFINRTIDAPGFISAHEDDNLVLDADNRERALGALQAALEASNVNARYEQADNVITYSELNRFDQFNRYTGMGSLSYGQPGYITQGDLLARLGTALTPRSDTFTIRAYGQSINPVSGNVTASARCEMVVQREPETITAGSTNRRFVIISFRWLDSSAI